MTLDAAAATVPLAMRNGAKRDGNLVMRDILYCY